ncbi:MAG TPA: DNA repair protein RecN [Afifellaceae bacterium]|nr:DNA repair protein RecN [Afifellaceae bacterium]
MLANLTVQDIVLINRLGIDFDAGLSVLTGETGAGKSILLDALSLAIGARGDASLVRSGIPQGQVTALFDLAEDHPVFDYLKGNDLDVETPLILRRVQTSDGKTRAFVNDQPCSVSLLKAVGSMLVEIHGQHDDRAMVAPEEHRRLVDAYGGLELEAEFAADCLAKLKGLERELHRLTATVEASMRELDYLQASVQELEALSPEPGEEERLAERRQVLMHSEKIAGDLNDAFDMIGGNASSVPDLSALLRRLERKAADVPGILDNTITALASALDNLEEVRLSLESAQRDTDFEPHELETTEERLFALRAAARKHQTDVDGLPALAADYASRLADIDSGRERLDELEAAIALARADYVSAAKILSRKRHDTATLLEEAVNAELPALKLDAARFIVDIQTDPDAETADGFDTVTFHVQTNPGTKPGPMMKVASGGELSRFLLALKVVLADRGSAPTLVFDEIDTGVGGAVAEAIGRRLSRLAERVQVLSVTHAPQVAARAGHHFLISKDLSDKKDSVKTMVEPIAADVRREEIARMLAGATISDEARAAADRLIAGEAA